MTATSVESSRRADARHAFTTGFDRDIDLPPDVLAIYVDVILLDAAGYVPRLVLWDDNALTAQRAIAFAAPAWRAAEDELGDGRVARVEVWSLRQAVQRTVSAAEARGRGRGRGRGAMMQVARVVHRLMTSVWVAEHGWCYLNAAIDCCTREIAAWAIDVRCRAHEATAVIDRAVAERGIPAGTLTLGTDNGTAYTSRSFRARLAEQGIAHRRGGYRDPESQAFLESWFSKLKLRCVWREEFETLQEAREKIAAYIDRYHHRPHSGLAYKTPREVAVTWKDHDDHLTPAA